MRLFFATKVRQMVGLALFLFFALPFGISVTGCGGHATPVTFCNAGDSGPIVGQISKIVLAPNFATVGESLNYGQIGSSLSATAYDCKGTPVSSRGYTFASTSSFNVNSVGGAIFADINPSTGQVCGGTWNRNTGGGIPNYTTCMPPSSTPADFLAYVTATSGGAVSNAIPVYVHPVAAGIVLGTASTDCTTDPGTDCAGCSPSTVGTVANPPPVYDPNPAITAGGCLSQNALGQLVARVYQGGNACPGGGNICPANNITCRVGHVTFAAQSSSVVTIDETGIATAHQPGSSVITATLSNSSTGTQAGYFATCPPASIALSIPGQPGVSTVNVGINNTQPITATIFDTKGVSITGLGLEFNSTTPLTVPASSTGAVTPLFPGSADITATCLPSACNPSPFSQIGLYGNGKPITSNPITINAIGTSSTVLYMGSTQSQYVQARDFTTNQPGALIKLPFIPNSMLIALNGTTIYFGSAQGLMSLTTANNTVGNVNTAVTGTLLAISPDGNALVISDPTRQTISLINGSGGVVSTYGGVGTHAQFTPDSQAVYVTTTTGTVLSRSNFTDWQPAQAEETYTDVAVTVPNIGAYFAGQRSDGTGTTDGRSYCPTSTVLPGATEPQKVDNIFIPLADQSTAVTDRIAATTDGRHILGAHANADGSATFSDIDVTYPAIPNQQPDGPGSCTTATGAVVFDSTFTTQPIPEVKTTPQPTVFIPTVGPTMEITGVFPSSNSAAAFVTYTGTSGLLPVYFPPASGKGSLQLVPLAFGATAASAPVAGVFSTDDLNFYAGTEGDNQVHIITLSYPAGSAPTAKDSGVIAPNLPNANGAASSPVNLLVQRPKRSTS